MIFYIIAVTINCIAILLVIGNAVYDAFTLEYSTGHNDMANLAGFALAAIVGLSWYLRNHDQQLIANILVWVPAVPLFLTGLMLLLLVVLKPDWK